MIAMAIYLIVFFAAAILLIVLLHRTVVEEDRRYTVGYDESTLPAAPAPSRSEYHQAA